MECCPNELGRTGPSAHGHYHQPPDYAQTPPLAQGRLDQGFTQVIVPNFIKVTRTSPEVCITAIAQGMIETRELHTLTKLTVSF